MPSAIDSSINALANWKVWKNRFPDRAPSEVNSKLKFALKKLTDSKKTIAQLSEAQPSRRSKTNCAQDAQDFFHATRDLMRSFCVTARAFEKFSELKTKDTLCKCLKSKLSEVNMKNIRDSLEASMKIYGDLAVSLVK